jgi:hypothetical protein
LGKISTNSKKDIEAWAEKHLLGSQWWLYGVTNGLPINVQSRLSVANIIPGTRLFMPSETSKGKQALELLGPTGGLIDQARVGLERMAAGEFISGLKEMAPRFARDFFKGYELLETGEYRDRKRNLVAKEVTTGEAVAKMTGWQPKEVAWQQREFYANQQDINLQRTMEAGIADQWANAVRMKDPEGKAEARRRMREWNRNHPEMPIRIKPSQISQRVKRMREDPTRRQLRMAPPEMRRQLRREQRERRELEG